MKINTPEGTKDCEALEFSLEEAERPVKLILADGTTLFVRCTIGAVFAYVDGDGQTQYCLNSNLSVVKIR